MKVYTLRIKHDGFSVSYIVEGSSGVVDPTLLV